MKATIIKRCIKYIFVLSSLILNSCVEEFIPETITFEDLLVVEATITDEFKFQEIKLSRTFQFEEELTFENQADVKIIDDNQNVYQFIEETSGKYVSLIKFSAEPNRSYTLHIDTKDNKSYTSASVNLPANTAQITRVSYIKTTNSIEDEGINIVVDSFDPMGNSVYYRYEYEETYIINPPFWSPHEAVILSDVSPFEVNFTQRTEEERVCYNTILNNNIIQAQTNGLTENRITEFPIKFISKNASIIRDRYSILVKQHVQSLEAYTYYETLNKFSNSESVFSENQPGFINGNIFSDVNANEKILGFFEINSVSTKRLFFNYKDVYPDENKPAFFTHCEELESPLLTSTNNPNSSPLIDQLNTGEYEIFDLNFDFFTGELDPLKPFFLINKECSDCTELGTNIKPDFWID